MELKEKISGLRKIINAHSKKIIIGLFLTGLVSITAKDNVHFGSVNLHNPKENHYAWGLKPTITIKGKAQGNYKSFGLIDGKNDIGDNSEVDGNMSSYGLIAGWNVIGDNSEVDGNMSGYGLIFGGNDIRNNSEINGNIISKGIFAITPFSTNIGSNMEIGLKNYIHKTKKK